MKNFRKHYEETLLISTSPSEVFNFADDYKYFLSHMNNSAWMMGGAGMETDTDGGKGQKIGSHIKMHGKVFGFNLFLDEVVTKYTPPYHKEWETVGDINLLVIDHYKLGFVITPGQKNSAIKVYIDYNIPKSLFGQLLGFLFGGIYAKWCVQQIIKGVGLHFNVIK